MINKKILYILPFLLFLFGCGNKKEDFYNLKIGDNEIVVGYDQTINENLPIEYKISNVNKKDVVTKITYYIDDLESEVYINGYSIESIKETCEHFSGDYIEKNGHACVFGKMVNGYENYVILYSDILSDDLDKVDRIEIYYE